MALTGESRDLTFDGGITEGLSKQGMEAYLDNLRLGILNDVGNALDNTDDLQQAINKGWQGVSRDKFVAQFNKAVETIKEDLAQEYADLVNKLSELAQNYYIQDANMIQD